MSMRELSPDLLPSTSRPVAGNVGAPSAAAHDGMLLFIQYSFMPNRLEYCGTDDHGALYDYWQARQADQGLRQILASFTGALPYLKLIAHSNGIADPFDRRVVEAYWVGSPLLDRVDMRQFLESLTARFDKQLQGKAREYVTGKIPLGARPHHGFHVFDVHSRVGQLSHSLEVMENCRVSWGQITAVEPVHFLVDAQPLVLQDGKLALDPAVQRRVLRQIDGKGFTGAAQVGDWVSIHWNWACDTLRPEQVARLESFTRQHLRLANLTL
jgi:hypothetical protein